MIRTLEQARKAVEGLTETERLELCPLDRPYKLYYMGGNVNSVIVFKAGCIQDFQPVKFTMYQLPVTRKKEYLSYGYSGQNHIDD